MTKKFQVAYIPIGVPTFHLESAQREFEHSIELLKNITEDVVAPAQMLLSLDLLNAFLDTLEPDLIVLQNVTFANAAYASEVLARFKQADILLWTLREPVIDGGRLRLNSLTGAYSAANTIRKFGRTSFEYIFGAPDEAVVQKKVRAVIAASQVKHDMDGMKLAAIGHTPQGFGFGRALDHEMLSKFGVRLESVEARELIERAQSYSDEDCEKYIQEAAGRMVGLENTPEKNRRDFARLYKAYEEYVTTNHIGALASRCWPDFFTSFGTPVCAVLAILNDLGVAAACEADTYGALSMYVAGKLSNSPTFFGDPVSMDEGENTITFWHCGTAACSLARTDTGAVVGEHCNRHIGPTMEFGCKASKDVTIFRVGQNEKGEFRFFVAHGEALDKPKQFFGTSIVVKVDGIAPQMIERTVLEGWEPHFVVAYGDITQELTVLGKLFDIPVERL